MMRRKEYTLSDRTCFLYQDEAAKHLLIQPIDEHDLEVLDQEVETIKELSDKPFSLVAFMIKDWNQELTPWVAPPVFDKAAIKREESEQVPIPWQSLHVAVSTIASMVSKRLLARTVLHIVTHQRNVNRFVRSCVGSGRE